MAVSLSLARMLSPFSALEKRLCVQIFHRYSAVRGVRGLRRKLDVYDEARFNEMMKQVIAQKMSEENLFVQRKNDSQPVKQKLTKQLAPSVKEVTAEDHEAHAEHVDVKDEDQVTMENQHERLAMKVTPLWNIPYEKQLKMKFFKSLKILRKFGASLRGSNSKVFIDPDNTPCALDRAVPSPCVESYRNKDEFSIRPGVDGNPKTVGFFLESVAENRDTFCVGPDKLIITKDSHKQVAKEFENYIRSSPLPACINFSEGGYWRNIVVRSNSDGDVMAVVIMHPRNLSEEQLEAERESLKEYFMHESRKYLNLKSLYFQACNHTRCSHAEAPYHLLFGEPYLIEEMNGLKFRISPESFFQVNTAAAANLYKIIFNACKPNEAMTVLDICCGTGPVSLTFSGHVKKCIGIDSSEQAIADAKANVVLNNVENVEFHAGRCENLLPDILNRIYAEKLIAVLNPARSALGKSVITSLRECRHLRKVVFVSCKPEAMIPNFVQLCGHTDSRGRSGPPFVPLRAAPVDLFPHTNHCELVVLFQRI